MDEPIRITRCEGTTPGCLVGTGERRMQCRTHDLWEATGRHLLLFLAAVTLADVLSGDVCVVAARTAVAEPAEALLLRHVYLDANASEPLRPEARTAMLAALELAGNPASVLRGRSCRATDPRGVGARPSRRRFAARPADVVFTSGGTEAVALAIHALGEGAPPDPRRDRA